MKKKILFAYPELGVGGSTTSLLSLLSLIDYNSYDVDLVLYRANEKQLKSIPKEVNFIGTVAKYSTDNRINFFKMFINYTLKGYFVKALYTECRHKRKIKLNSQILSQIASIESIKIEKQYDVAIGFLEYWANDYVVNQVEAAKKIVWIHTDYLKANYIPLINKEMFAQSDLIVHVAKECMDNFNTLFPDITHKSIVVNNITSSRIIRGKSNEIITDFTNEYGGFKIITVCRLDIYTKGLDRVINISKRLKELKYDFKWYVIGNGNDKGKLQEMVQMNYLNEYVILLGEKENPFPYIKRCDLFCLPSRFEGKPIAVTEAQILSIPPLVTNYSSASSQVTNNVDGRVVKNEENDIYEAIVELYNHRNILERYQKYLVEKEYGNDEMIREFYKILK